MDSNTSKETTMNANATQINKIKDATVRASVQHTVSKFPGAVVAVTGKGWDTRVEVRYGDWLDLYGANGAIAHLNTRKN